MKVQFLGHTYPVGISLKFHTRPMLLCLSEGMSWGISDHRVDLVTNTATMDPSPASRGAKRSLNHTPASSGRMTKRARVDSSGTTLDGYSKAERTILQGAAEILDIPLGRLLDVAGDTTTLPTRTSSVGTWRLIPDSASHPGTQSEHQQPEDEQDGNIDGATAPTGPTTEPFALQLPDISQRAKRRELLDTLNTAPVVSGQTTAPARTLSADSSNAAVQGSPVIWWLDGMFDLTFPMDVDPNDPGFQAGNNDFDLGESLASDDRPDPPMPSTGHVDVPLPSINVHAAPSISNPTGSRQVMDISESVTVASPIDSGPSPRATRNVGGYLTPSHSSMTKSNRKRRGPFDEKQRQETGFTRKLVACIRCSHQRIRVCLI